MKRLAMPVSIAVALVLAAVLFHVKHQVRDLERELRMVNGAIQGHREAIQVLESEWSYLNQPERIAELAARHLDMRAIDTDRVIRLEDIPFRTAPAQTAATPGPGRPAGSTQLTAAPQRKGAKQKLGALQ